MWATDHPHLTLDGPKHSISERGVSIDLIDTVFQGLPSPAKICLTCEVEDDVEFLFFSEDDVSVFKNKRENLGVSSGRQ